MITADELEESVSRLIRRFDLYIKSRAENSDDSGSDAAAIARGVARLPSAAAAAREGVFVENLRRT